MIEEDEDQIRIEENVMPSETRYRFRAVKASNMTVLDQWFGHPVVKTKTKYINHEKQQDTTYGFAMSFIDDPEKAFIMENASQAFFVFLSLSQAAEIHGYKLMLEPVLE